MNKSKLIDLIAVVYFSGTGNTEVVAGFIVNELEKYFSVDIFKVEDIIQKKATFDLGKYQMIGLGYPIYGFNAPRIILDFIKQLPENYSQKAFVFSTCAGPLYLNDIASCKVKKLLEIKSLKVFYERQFYMPANIATRYNDEVAKQLCNAALRKSVAMADEIRNGTEKIRNDRIGPRLLTWLYYFEKSAWKRIPKDFIVLESCIKCNKCVRDCPMGNISFSNDRIFFGENCLACYRCVYLCPSKAITGKKYKFAIFKDGYNIKKIIENDGLKGNYITLKTRGYYRILKKYLFKE